MAKVRGTAAHIAPKGRMPKHRERYGVEIQSTSGRKGAQASIHVIDVTTGRHLSGTTTRFLSPQMVGILVEDHRERRAARAPRSLSAVKHSINRGLAEVDAGLTIPFEKVEAWMASWGSLAELPMPRADRRKSKIIERVLIGLPADVQAELDRRAHQIGLSLPDTIVSVLCGYLKLTAQASGRARQVKDLNRGIDQAMAELDHGEGLLPEESRRRQRAFRKMVRHNQKLGLYDGK